MSSGLGTRIDNRCVLCGKPREQVKKLILGMHGGICLDCVELCNEIIHNDLQHTDQSREAALSEEAAKRLEEAIRLADTANAEIIRLRTKLKALRYSSKVE